MKMKNIYRTLLLAAGLFAVSCEKEVDPLSEVQTFEAYSPALAAETPVVTANEQDGATVHTFHFTLDERQMTDVLMTISVGSSSTAEEGVDFDLLTHEVEFPAFGGAEGFDVEIVTYPDFEPEEGETIYLTFTSETPSGLDDSEVLVVNLEDWPVCDYDFATMPGAATGIDITLDGVPQDPYESEVVISGTPGAFKITGLGVGWMTDFWGEVIVTMLQVNMDVEDVNDYVATVTIPKQTYMTTTYNGAPQEAYTIEGTGTLIKCTKKLVIEYTLSNYGEDWAAYTHDNGYMSEEKFTAVVTLP